jgi:hypothetical protein
MPSRSAPYPTYNEYVGTVLIRLDSSISMARTVDQLSAQFVEQHRTASPIVAAASRGGRKDMARSHLSCWFIWNEGFLALGADRSVWPPLPRSLPHFFVLAVRWRRIAVNVNATPAPLGRHSLVVQMFAALLSLESTRVLTGRRAQRASCDRQRSALQKYGGPKSPTPSQQ